MGLWDDIWDGATKVVCDSLDVIEKTTCKTLDIVSDVADTTINFVSENKDTIKTVSTFIAPPVVRQAINVIDVATSNNSVEAITKTVIQNSPVSQVISQSTNALSSYHKFLKARNYADLEDIKYRRIGDHLVTERTGYTHHGIYIGNDTVIHYAGFANGISSGKIEKTSLASFSNGQQTYVKRYFNAKYTGEDAVKRAESRLGEDLYNVLLNNCEHFATWCVMGEHRSAQLEDIYPNSMTVIANLIR